MIYLSYDSEGRLTNVTFPTGVVTNLHGEMEKAITVDIESSSREEDVSITSNLSSIDSFYTMVQGIVKRKTHKYRKSHTKLKTCFSHCTLRSGQLPFRGRLAKQMLGKNITV